MIILSHLFILNTYAQNCDSRIPIEDKAVSGQTYKYLISESGSYYFTDTIYISGGNSDGIEITASNVTLDLNGFALIGDDNTDDGIIINGNNIIIKNGIITRWGGDGIEGRNTSQVMLDNLKSSDNGSNGMIINNNSLIINSQSMRNGSNGINSDDSNIIFNTITSENVGEGIEVSIGSIVINSQSYSNEDYGINTLNGSLIDNCSANGNSAGIYEGIGNIIINSFAYDNSTYGIYAGSAGLIMNNVCNYNGSCRRNNSCTSDGHGTGIWARINAFVHQNTCSNNYFGIISEQRDVIISENYALNSYHAGIISSEEECIFLNNYTQNNGGNPISGSPYSSGNFDLGATGAYGPIINVSTAGDISNTSNANFPWANFEF